MGEDNELHKNGLEYNSWELNSFRINKLDGECIYSNWDGPYSSDRCTFTHLGLNIEDVSRAINEGYCNKLCPYSDECHEYMTSNLCAKHNILRNL